MSDEKRAKLDTAIEREVHKLIQNISESLYDRLNIYVRRNEVPIDMDVFNTLVKTMQASITEFEIFNGATPNQIQFWNELISKLTVLDFDSQAARVAATVVNNLKCKIRLN